MLVIQQVAAAQKMQHVGQAGFMASGCLGPAMLGCTMWWCGSVHTEPTGGS